MIAMLRANLLATGLGIAAAVFMVIAIAQSVEINGFLWIDGLKDEIADCARDRNELRELAKKKNEQRKTTADNIDRAVNHRIQADRVAERIENAPTAPNCATPREVMEAPL